MFGPNRVDEEHNFNQSKRNGVNGSNHMPGKETLLINVDERERVSSVLERLKADVYQIHLFVCDSLVQDLIPFLSSVLPTIPYKV